MNKLTLLIALAAASLSTPMIAAERTPNVTVGYADLQLASAAGQARLDRRISTAIDASCGVDPSERSLAAQRAATKCVVAKQAEVGPARWAALARQGAVDRFASASR